MSEKQEWSEDQDYFEEELFNEKDIVEKADYLFEEIKKLKIQLKKVR